MKVWCCASLFFPLARNKETLLGLCSTPMEIEKWRHLGLFQAFNLPSRYNLALQLRFGLVAALCGFLRVFFDGLALLFELFGLSVGFSLSRGGGVCLLLGMLGVSTKIISSLLA